MKLTKEEAVNLHRELWGWLAENPMKKKPDWPGWVKNPKSSHCFLCDYDRKQGKGFCVSCPVEFKTNGHDPGSISYCLGGLFGAWQSATAPEERSKYAALIRDLPEKKEEKPALKVGDWIKIVNVGSCFDTYGEFFNENGVEQFMEKYKSHSLPSHNETCKIIAIGKHSGDVYGPLYLVESLADRVYIMHNIDSKCLELTDPPAPKFQIGDKVVPVSKTVPGHTYSIDKEHGWKQSKERGYFYIVAINERKTNEFGKTVYECNADKGDGYGNYFLESDLIPYVEPPKFKFKVGDKVRAIAATNCWDKVKVGDVGIISCTPDMHPVPTSNLYRADFPNYKNWNGKEECFELVVDEPKEVKPEPIKVQESYRIKVAEKHLPLVMEYGAISERCRNMGAEEGYGLLKEWTNKVRSTLGTDKTITFNPQAMEFIIFDALADKINFNNSKTLANPDGTYYLEI